MPEIIEKSVKSKFKDLNLRNNYWIVSSARKGLNTEIFYDFADTINMTERNLALLINLSSRTISNYKEKQKKLEPIYSEHLLKIIALFEKGEALFGNSDEFICWLKKPFWGSSEKPIDWIKTSGGVDLVIDEMDKLSEGYPI